MSDNNGASPHDDDGDVTDVVIDVSQPEPALDAAQELCSEGDYAEAIELAVLALERFADAGNVMTARFHNVLASAYQATGALAESARSADAAIAALEEGPDSDAVELGVACHTRAVCYLHAGKIDEATPLLDRAAESLEEAGPDARIDFGLVLLTMAEVASASGAADGAGALCERVITEMTHAPPTSEEHARALNRVTARAFLGLGSSYAQRGETDEAKDYLARAVEFFDAGFGHGHPEMTAGLVEVAALYRAIGDEDAAAVIDEELAVVKKALG